MGNPACARMCMDDPTMWMTLEDIMLSVIDQSPKDTHDSDSPV